MTYSNWVSIYFHVIRSAVRCFTDIGTAFRERQTYILTSWANLLKFIAINNFNLLKLGYQAARVYHTNLDDKQQQFITVIWITNSNSLEHRFCDKQQAFYPTLLLQEILFNCNCEKWLWALTLIAINGLWFHVCIMCMAGSVAFLHWNRTSVEQNCRIWVNLSWHQRVLCSVVSHSSCG